MSSGLPAHVEEADLISYGLIGLINSFRMARIPEPVPSSSTEAAAFV